MEKKEEDLLRTIKITTDKLPKDTQDLLNRVTKNIVEEDDKEKGK